MQSSFRLFPFLIFIITMISSLAPALAPALAQNFDFESLMLQRRITCIVETADKVVGGLDGGGILVWDPATAGERTRLSSCDGLSGNNVTALAWTGRYLWVATAGNGLTRISDVGGDTQYRLYASNLGSLDISAVSGLIVGESERVFYGMNDGGLGLITDGISGPVYTAEQDGLIDNDVKDLQFYNGALFVATPSGISRFANNLFSDQNTGLSNTDMGYLALDPDGNLVAGGAGGVFIWDADTESWSNLNRTSTCRGLSGNGDLLWCLSSTSAFYYSGTTWTAVSVPRTGLKAIGTGVNTWIGGSWRGPEMSNSSGLAWYGRYDGVDSFSDELVEASLVYNGYGLDFDHEGTVWYGSYLGTAISSFDGESFSNISQLASAENDSSGLFAYGSNVLALAADHERGLVYTGQFTQGIVRKDLATGDLDLMFGGTCGLEEHPWTASRMISLMVHPDGTLLVMYDEGHEQKVRILTDPIHWRGDANWYDVPQGSEGIGNGVGVWDAVVQRNDVIWFAVEGTGLVRWDINGSSAGPDDELTWDDFTDDSWDGPFGSISGTPNDPSAAKTRLALAPDGSIWFGGNGVTRFSYNEIFGTLELEEHYSTKTASFQAGLIDGNVRDVEVDGNGDLWVTSSLGLNRIRWGTREPEIDAYFDLANYFSNSAFALLYSPNVITGLPGGVYAKVAASADGKKMALTSNKGAVVWDITQSSGPGVESLAALYCYPNPWTPEGSDSGLKLGGISADADNEDPAVVVVYNLSGQIVYKNSYVSARTALWDGKNRVGQPVATGMYVVKVTWRGETAVRTLAIVR